MDIPETTADIRLCVDCLRGVYEGWNESEWEGLTEDQNGEVVGSRNQFNCILNGIAREPLKVQIGKCQNKIYVFLKYQSVAE